MKTGKKVLIALPVAIIIAYLCLPFYAKKALIHWFPTIDDLGIFEHATVHAPDSCIPAGNGQFRRITILSNFQRRIQRT